MPETSRLQFAAPKSVDYVVVDGSQGPRRDFRVARRAARELGRRGPRFRRFRSGAHARAWMKRRVEAGQPALSDMFTSAEVTYARPRPDASVGSDREPIALFTGEAAHAYLGHLPDSGVVAMLNELAGELGAALGQDRVRRQDLDFGCWRPVNMAPGQDLGMSGGSTIGAEGSAAPLGLRTASRAASRRHDTTRREWPIGSFRGCPDLLGLASLQGPDQIAAEPFSGVRCLIESQDQMRK